MRNIILATNVAPDSIFMEHDRLKFIRNFASTLVEAIEIRIRDTEEDELERERLTNSALSLVDITGEEPVKRMLISVILSGLFPKGSGTGLIHMLVRTSLLELFLSLKILSGDTKITEIIGCHSIDTPSLNIHIEGDTLSKAVIFVLNYLTRKLMLGQNLPRSLVGEVYDMIEEIDAPLELDDVLESLSYVLVNGKTGKVQAKLVSDVIVSIGKY